MVAIAYEKKPLADGWNHVLTTLCPVNTIRWPRVPLGWPKPVRWISDVIAARLSEDADWTRVLRHCPAGLRVQSACQKTLGVWFGFNRRVGAFRL